MKFKDKVILVTGSSSGIGRAVALRIARDGATLLLVARNLDKLNEVKKEVEDLGSKCEVFSVDVTNVGQVRNLFLEATKDGRKLDAVFNNAGIGFVGNIWEIKAEEIEKIISVNVTGMILVSKFASEVMTRQREGHIFMTSSLAGLVTLPQWSVYVASKWAITGFADSIRAELKPLNVKVTTLHPGGVRTNFFDKDKANIDIGKMGEIVEPEEIAENVYNAFFSERKKLIVPSTVKSYAYLKRYIPALSDYLIERLASKIEYRGEKLVEDEPEFSYIGNSSTEEDNAK